MVEATWVNVGGVWGIRIVSGEAKPGDVVMVRRRTGTATSQTLGEQLRPGVFAKAGQQSAVRQRGRYRPARGYAPAPLWDAEQAAEMRACYGVDSYGDSLRGSYDDRD